MNVVLSTVGEYVRKRLRQNYILPWHNPLSQRESPAALQEQSSVTCVHDACVSAPAHGGQWLISNDSLIVLYLLTTYLSHFQW